MSFLDSLIYGIRAIRSGNTDLPTRNAINFIGPGVVVTDNPAKDQTDVLIEAGGGGGITTVGTLDDLRAIPSAGLVAELRLVEETGILWRYDAETGADEIDDGAVSVKPDDKAQAEAGRWRPVVHSGQPGIPVLPGVVLPAARIPASVVVLGARPIVDGAPGGAPAFAGVAIDMGDEGRTKKSMPVVGLDEDAWSFLDVQGDTLASTPLYRFGRDGLRIYSIQGEGARRIYVDGRKGTRDEVERSLIIEAAAAVDRGGSVIIKPGKSGVWNARRGDAVLATEDYVPVVSVTSDERGNPKLAFFGATHVTKPIVTGSKSDGSAWESLLDALVALGLVEDQTTP